MKKVEAETVAHSINGLIFTKDVKNALVNGADKVIIHTYVGLTDPYEDQWSTVRQEIETFDGKATSTRYHYQEGQWKLLEKPLEFIGKVETIQRDVYECM